MADENKKLRSLLQQNGVSHATIEAYLKGSSANSSSSSAQIGGNVNSLEHLMVPRFPLQYTSPLIMSGTLSATGSVGPSSPSGGDDTATSGYMSYDNSNSNSNTSPPEASKSGSSNRGSGGSSSHNKSHGHGHSSHGHSHRDKGKKTSSSGTMPTTTTTTDYSGYLSPGYGLSTAFYGLDGTSAEDLHYGSGSGGAGTGAEPILFDYSVSPQYLGEGGGAGTGSVSGVSQPPVSAPYYGMMGSGSGGGGGSGNTAGSFVRSCPACMSGMGCSIHSGFFEE